MAPKSASAASATKLELAELGFYWDGQLALKLHGDGGIEAKLDNPDWKRVGTLSADGVLAEDGKEMVHLADDGAFVMDGKPAGLKLENDALVGGGTKVTIDAQGNVEMDPPKTASPDWKPMRVEGVTNAGTRRAGLVLVALLFLERAAPAPAATSSSAVAPAPAPAGPNI